MTTQDYITEITSGYLALVNDFPSDTTVLGTGEYFSFMYFTEYFSFLRNYKQYHGTHNYNEDLSCYDIDVKKQSIDSGYYITTSYKKLLEPTKGRVIVVTTSDLTKCILLDNPTYTVIDTRSTLVPETVLTDLDGNEYDIITIENQQWIGSNLKTTKYADGSSIPNITDATLWGLDTLGAYCYYNNDEATYKIPYGVLYNNYVCVNNVLIGTPGSSTLQFTSNGLKSDRWRVPTKADGDKLRDNLNGWLVAGGKLKETGLTHWNTPNDWPSLNTTNSSGFTAVGSGRRFYTGISFSTLKQSFWLWTQTQHSVSNAYANILSYNSEKFNAGMLGEASGADYHNGYSIRCVRDL